MLTTFGRKQERERGKRVVTQSVRCVSEHSSSDADGGSQFGEAGIGHGLLYYE